MNRHPPDNLPAEHKTAALSVVMPAPDPLTPEQRQAFLDVLREHTTIGTIRALRQVGIKGSKGQLHALIDEDLEEQAREARGWNIRAVEATTWLVAADPTHDAWDRANARILKAYGGPQYRDRVEHEHAGSLEVTNTDVAAAIDRFTGQVVRLAERSRAELAASKPGG